MLHVQNKLKFAVGKAQNDPVRSMLLCKVFSSNVFSMHEAAKCLSAPFSCSFAFKIWTKDMSLFQIVCCETCRSRIVDACWHFNLSSQLPSLLSSLRLLLPRERLLQHRAVSCASWKDPSSETTTCFQFLFASVHSGWNPENYPTSQILDKVICSHFTNW